MAVTLPARANVQRPRSCWGLAKIFRGGAKRSFGTIDKSARRADQGLLATPNPIETKLALLHRAAELGHAGAQRGYEVELQKSTNSVSIKSINNG